MGRDSPARQRTLTAALIVLGGVAAARADPLVAQPVLGKASWGDPGEQTPLVGLVLEVRALGVLTADRLTWWPDRRIGIEPRVPQLVAARPGFVGIFPALDLALVARLDAAEPSRPRLDDRALPVADALVDDFYGRWMPSPWARVTLGRARVPWSVARQVEEVDEPFGAAPFVVDRVAPDRRWGTMVDADLGALSWAAGAWEDVDALEARERAEDPSRGGAVMFGANVGWTPRAPINGSNPPGAVVGARGPLPTPRADPWFDTARVAAGLGGLGRLRRDGSFRADAAASGQLKWRALSAVAEVIVSRDHGRTAIGGHAEAYVTPVDRVALGLRGEWDGGAPEGGAWSGAGTVSWAVTKDRRNRLALEGWLRRDVDRGTPFDGLVVFLQASL